MTSRPWFRRLRGLRDAVRDNHPDVVDLSMGMSLDYGVAVEEGATMVRIGTALFGPRSAVSYGRKCEMAGVWKKTLNYLGLVEEDEDFVDDMPEAEPAPVRRMRPQPSARCRRRRRASSARSRRRGRRRAGNGRDPQVRTEAVQRGA